MVDEGGNHKPVFLLFSFTVYPRSVVFGSLNCERAKSPLGAFLLTKSA